MSVIRRRSAFGNLSIEPLDHGSAMTTLPACSNITVAWYTGVILSSPIPVATVSPPPEGDVAPGPPVVPGALVEGPAEVHAEAQRTLVRTNATRFLEVTRPSLHRPAAGENTSRAVFVGRGHGNADARTLSTQS